MPGDFLVLSFTHITKMLTSSEMQVSIILAHSNSLFLSDLVFKRAGEKESVSVDLMKCICKRCSSLVRARPMAYGRRPGEKASVPVHLMK